MSRHSWSCLTLCSLCQSSGPDAGTTALRKWFNSFVIAGINGQEQEKNGTLEYLATDLKTSLFTLDLRQLGVYRLGRLNNFGENIQRIQARLYCEQIVFGYANNAAAPSDNPASLPSLTLVGPTLPKNVVLPPANQGSAPPGQPLRVVPTAASRAPRDLDSDAGAAESASNATTDARAVTAAAHIACLQKSLAVNRHEPKEAEVYSGNDRRTPRF